MAFTSINFDALQFTRLTRLLGVEPNLVTADQILDGLEDVLKVRKASGDKSLSLSREGRRQAAQNPLLADATNRAMSAILDKPRY